MRTAQILLSLLCVATAPVAAQRIPSSSSLARLGLERAWVSQARVDSSRGKLTHLTVDERYVYAQATNGSLTAFDAETGNRHWSVRLGAPGRTTFAAVSNADIVLVITGSKLFGVEKSSGHLAWSAKMPVSASTSALMDDKYFYVGTTDGSVYAFNTDVVEYNERHGRLPGSFNPVTRESTSPIGPVAATNIWMWRYRTGRSLNQPPIMAARSILLGDTGGQIYGITGGPPEELGGKLVFQFQAGQGQAGSMFSKGTTTYVTTGDNRLLAVDSTQGRVLWQYAVGHRILGNPLLIENTIYLTTESEGLIAINAESGRQVATRNGPWWIPRATGMVGRTATTLYATDRQWNLVAVNKDTASRQGQLSLVPFKKRIANDLNNRLYMATEQGLIMCLRATGANEMVFYRNADRSPISPLLDGEAGSGTKGSGTKGSGTTGAGSGSDTKGSGTNGAGSGSDTKGSGTNGAGSGSDTKGAGSDLKGSDTTTSTGSGSGTQ